MDVLQAIHILTDNIGKYIGLSLSISVIDSVIILAYLIGVVLLGLWIGRGKKTLSDYLLGGRDLPWWALLGSIVATETSTATVLSVPGIAFAGGGDLRFLQLPLGYILGRFLVTVLLLPHFFRGEIYTAYQLLELRFGALSKQTASLLFLVTRNLGDGLRLFLTAIVLEKVIGFSLPACIVLIGVATIVYTYFGGMRSVVWNDCLQFVIYMAGGCVALPFIVQALPGGWQQLSEFATANQKFRVFDFSLELTKLYTFWGGLIGGMFLTLGTHGTDQMMVQRYLSARSRRDAGRALILSGFVVLVQFALFLLIGVGLACFYDLYPPDSEILKDHAFASFIVDYMPVGVVGLLLAAVFAAAMSTLSSSLNSSAAAALNDFYLPRKKIPNPSQNPVAVSRLLTVFFGVIQIGIGIGADYFSRSVVNEVLAIAGFTAGILLGIFCLGIFSRRVGQNAALTGMLAGLAAVSYVKFGTDVKWPWYAVTGALVTFLIGLLASLLQSPAKRPVETENE